MMKKQIFKNLILLTILLSGCSSSSLSDSLTSTGQPSSQELPLAPFSIRSFVDEFNFDYLNNLLFSFEDVYQREVSHIEGNNISSGDYTIEDGLITINRNYLAYLSPGTYSLDLMTTLGRAPFSFKVLDKNNPFRIINESFETGDLFGWQSETIFKGEHNLQAFSPQAIVSNNFDLDTINHGQYLLGKPDNISASSWQEKLGRLISSPFTLSGTGYISFLLSQGKNGDLTYLSVRLLENDHEIARFSNHLPALENPYQLDSLIAYKANLSQYLNEKLYLEVIDLGSGADNYLIVDQLQTYHQTIPNETYHEAINQRPIMNIDYAPNQLFNGDFSLQLLGWTPSLLSGWTNNTFHVSNNILKSNASGDSSRGLIRSMAFRIDGTGFISLNIGAAQGARFDKDTFVSIRLTSTNREIMRFANHKHNGEQMIKYYADLSNYLGKTAYFEIVDNASSSWDTIFVSNIQTYYPTITNISYDLLARNLNY